MIRPDRRAFLLGSAGVALSFAGCSAAEPVRAGAPRLVVIVARGAMDGLSVAVPTGDRSYRGLRGDLAIRNALRLDGDFGLHPALETLHGLHDAQQMRFAPAVAIPARLRSHFDAQDVLESGGAAVREQQDGWLNRALGVKAESEGLAIGSQTPLILAGRQETASWAPGAGAASEGRLASLLQDLYVGDPLLSRALAIGLETEAEAASAAGGQIATNDSRGIGQAVARLMTVDQGADMVALSLDGYDTHARQGADEGQLASRLSVQDQLIDGLSTGLGDAWSRTVVVVATEFGRTARANGTGGTDHGTASTALLTGGALRRGGLIGDWPTLAENRLFEGRDLAPTLDVRSIFKGLLRDHMGLDQTDIERTVFPDSAEAPPVTGLV